MTPLRIGAHISISSGIPKAIETCELIGANTYQFFTRNPRGGAQRTIPDAEIAEGLELAPKAGVAFPVAHMPYTVNMASPKKQARSFARMVLHDDLELLDRMQVPFAVVHPGSHVGSGIEEAMQRIVDAVTHAFEETDSSTTLLLETMAGQGTELGGTFEQLAGLLDKIGHGDRIGVCMDSAHLFGAGHDLRTPEGVQQMLHKADTAFGLDRVQVFHLNDTRFELGSRKDRHERLGDGELGSEGIASIVNNEFIQQLPLILEVPTDTYGDYGPQITMVKDMVQGGS